MKRRNLFICILALSLSVLIVLLMVLSSCGEKANEKEKSSASNKVAVLDEDSKPTSEKPSESEGGVSVSLGSEAEYYAENKDGVIKGNEYLSGAEFDLDAEYAFDDGELKFEATLEAPCEDYKDDYPAATVVGEQATAGTLTAGELRDRDDFAAWRVLLEGQWNGYGDQWKLNTANKVGVHVTTKGGVTARGANVRLLDESGNTIYAAVTDTYGNAYLFYGVEGLSQYVSPETVWVNYNGYEQTSDFSGNEYSFTFDSEASEGAAAKALDLMFVVDTTGSMGDEIAYLKAEVKELINRAAETGFDVRTSVNFYRDETDAYVVKYYGFETDPEKVKQIVAEQYADGGGDYEEAVHTALSNAVYDHAWRKDSVKIMFLILDAPPHKTAEIIDEISATIIDAAAMGVHIIPVASSGIDKETEFLLRSYALLTGGSYAFLTDTSGVGLPHTEPTAQQYEEELLIDLMTRLIYEYCGVNYTSPEIGFDIDSETENPALQPENPDIITESGDPIDLNGDGMIDLSGDESIETVISCTSEWKFPYLRDIIAGTAEIGAVKNEGFVNVDEHPIGSEDEAIDRAKNEATVHYDIVLVAYDDVDCVWVVHFSLRDTLGGDQLVYLGKDGKTVLVVYGE